MIDSTFRMTILGFAALLLVSLTSMAGSVGATDGGTPSGNSDSCCVGPFRGNVDYDAGNSVNVSDLTYLVNFLFLNGPPPPCIDEGDLNGDGGISIGDLTYLVEYLFGDWPPPVPC